MCCPMWRYYATHAEGNDLLGTTMLIPQVSDVWGIETTFTLLMCHLLNG